MERNFDRACSNRVAVGVAQLCMPHDACWCFKVVLESIVGSGNVPAE